MPAVTGGASPILLRWWRRCRPTAGASLDEARAKSTIDQAKRRRMRRSLLPAVTRNLTSGCNTGIGGTRDASSVGNVFVAPVRALACPALEPSCRTVWLLPD
jgi:hypothetical protein